MQYTCTHNLIILFFGEWKRLIISFSHSPPFLNNGLYDINMEDRVLDPSSPEASTVFIQEHGTEQALQLLSDLTNYHEDRRNACDVCHAPIETPDTNALPVVIWNADGDKCMEFHWGCLFKDGSWEEFESVINQFAYTYTKFSPCSQGCAHHCPILNNEREICCDSARQCCFTCMDLECPIKDIYRDIITVYDGVLNDDNDLLDTSRRDDIEDILDRLGRDIT